MNRWLPGDQTLAEGDAGADPQGAARCNGKTRGDRRGAEASRLMAELMGKRREVSVVEVVQPASEWGCDGQPQASRLVANQRV